MKNLSYWYKVSLGGAVIAALNVASLAGEENENRSEIDALRLQLERMQAEAEEQQAVNRRHLEELQSQLARLERERAVESAPPVGDAPLAEAAEISEVSGGTWRPLDGLRLGAGQRDFLNISLIGTFVAGASTEEHVEDLQGGHHDPSRRGFGVQGIELALDGIVDPFFRAQANIIFTPEGHGHGGGVELEEAYLETLALPGNLQIRAGQFFTEFGRHNTQHLHFWKFVDQPLINTRMFGPDGLRNPGVRVSWLMPTTFYSELFLTAQDSTGETAYSFRNDHGFNDSHVFFRPARVDRDRGEEIRSLSDLLYTVRYAASTDLTESQTILGGVSAAFGPNSPTEPTGTQQGSPAGRTEIYGADFYWLWAPEGTGLYPFVSWQTEAMWRRFEMRNPTNVFEDYGFYSQVNYGFTRGWVAGLRYDWVRGAMADVVDRGGDSLELANRWRLSPNLTYYPSEFSKLRLQYNYDERSGIGTDHSVWLQWEFALGPHGAHPF